MKLSTALLLCSAAGTSLPQGDIFSSEVSQEESSSTCSECEREKTASSKVVFLPCSIILKSFFLTIHLLATGKRRSSCKAAEDDDESKKKRAAGARDPASDAARASTSTWCHFKAALWSFANSSSAVCHHLLASLQDLSPWVNYLHFQTQNKRPKFRHRGNSLSTAGYS